MVVMMPAMRVMPVLLVIGAEQMTQEAVILSRLVPKGPGLATVNMSTVVMTAVVVKRFAHS
jgi:hypothetical protein